MTTITLTHAQLKAAMRRCLECQELFTVCKQANCPIWKRAEKRAEKRKAKPKFVLPECGDDRRMKEKELQSKHLLFGPAKVVGGGIVNTMGRSGTPPHVARLWCGKCRTKRGHSLCNTGEMICDHCGSWRLMQAKKPHPIAGYAMADYCECCQKPIKGRTYRTADDVKLCRSCHGELANEPVGRSGTSLVKDGKIVRLPKKRLCLNCGYIETCGSYTEYGKACPCWKPRRKG